MSADNGLRLQRDTKNDLAYSLWYWSGESHGEKIYESNDIFDILAAAERQQVGTEYNVYLSGWSDE